jgi:multiple sugar transport system ATP-binding protein
MGRAMVREPKAFLMDEPLSNLDAKLRVSMRSELARLHDRLGVTTVYVTHDQVEAMTLGQRVAVLRDGLLQQCDTPQALFHHPVNLFVAAFIGSPSMNLVEAAVSDGRVTFADITLPLPSHSPLLDADRRVILGVRPTDIRHTADAQADHPRIGVRPDVVEELGGVSNVLFPVDAARVATDATRAAVDAATDDEGTLLADDLRARFCASIDGRRHVAVGEEVELAVDHRHLHFFDRETGAAIVDGRAAADRRDGSSRTDVSS